MNRAFSRTQLLLGLSAMERLAAARVAVFGVGGVGGYAVEALARSGIGALDLIDNDRVSETNLNRQIIALHSTVGKSKVEVAAARIKDIHPDCCVRTYELFYLPETAEQFDFSRYDYIVDAIDTVTGKLQLALSAKEAGIPIISAMGAGNKLDPTAFRVSDLSKTKNDPLCRIMRKELGKRGIRHLKVVWSEELPLAPQYDEGAAEEMPKGHRATPGSVAFVPSSAGLIIAGTVIKDLCGITQAVVPE